MGGAANLQAIIDEAFERRAQISASSASTALKEAVAQVLAQLDSGALRVCEKRDGESGVEAL